MSESRDAVLVPSRALGDGAATQLAPIEHEDEEEAEKPFLAAAGEKEKPEVTSPTRGPVFLELPDGSLVQGVPVGYKEQPAPSTPPAPTLSTVSALWDAAGVQQLFMPPGSEVVKTLARHELAFLILLLGQLISECAFEALNVQWSEDALFELALLYPTVPISALASIHWSAIGAESVFSLMLFCLGVLAACRGQPRHYQRFAVVALAGTLGQLPLAYLNRFNLLVFLERLISYAYARFICNLLRNLQEIYSGGMLF